MLQIVKYPNELLREKSKEVKLPLSREDRKLLDDMYNWVKENNETAVGLSAIQIGVPKRMCAIRHNRDGRSFSYKLVNPKITMKSNKQVVSSEGCVSIPNEEGMTSRYESITVIGYDAITNKNVRLSVKGFDAAILQHEIDHMDGVLYIDKVVQTVNH